MAKFRDRIDAGRQLGKRLGGLEGPDVVVLGLVRGGVPVAAEVARHLRAPLDVIVIRKLGLPSQPEVAMGAIAEGGERVVERRTIEMSGVSELDVAQVEERERRELERRTQLFRGGRARLELRGRTVIVVDDGVATGATARVACRAVRRLGASRILLAVPVGPFGLTPGDVDADELVCLAAPQNFGAVGLYYDDFRPTEDEEVRELLYDADVRCARVAKWGTNRWSARTDDGVQGRSRLPCAPVAATFVTTIERTRRNVSQLLLTAFSNRVDAVQLAREVGQRLDGEGVTWALHLLDLDDRPDIDGATMVVSLGGDGTFLKSARLAHQVGARVLAVNLGRMGFLLNVPPTEIVDDVKDAFEGEFVAERLALQISTSGSDVDEFALNEVVVERAHAGHMVRLKTFVDDEEFLTYSADGVMVASPTGSTGYNFSAGGPVVEATLPVMILTPIAPHFTINRSIVVADDKVIRLVADDKPAVIVADGQAIGSLEPGQFVEVRKSPSPVRVVATRSFDLAFRLRESLREGHA